MGELLQIFSAGTLVALNVYRDDDAALLAPELVVDVRQRAESTYAKYTIRSHI